MPASAGCYRDLDYSNLKCDVTAKVPCPDGYLCSAAGLCVKASLADGSATEAGPPAGKVTVFELPSSLDSADYITLGADGCFWFSGQKNNAIGPMCP